jgi:hypothetical protein
MAPMSKAAIRPAYSPSPGPSKRAALVTTGALSALVVAVLLILGFGAPGFFLTRQLDVRQAQAGVERILTDPTGYDAKNVSDVICNGGHNPSSRKGKPSPARRPSTASDGCFRSGSPTMRATTRSVGRSSHNRLRPAIALTSRTA